MMGPNSRRTVANRFDAAYRHILGRMPTVRFAAEGRRNQTVQPNPKRPLSRDPGPERNVGDQPSADLRRVLRRQLSP